MTVTRIALLVALTVASSASLVHAQAPPPSSPAARGERPRMFFTSADIPEIRQRIKTHYASDFQDLLDQLGNPNKLSKRQREHEADWGSMNAALVAALGPAELASLGFKLPSHLNTKEALCTQAMTYAREKLPQIASAYKLSHSALITGYSYAVYLPVAATYDWCHAQLSQPDRAAIADAFVSMHDKKYAGRNVLTMKVNSLDRLANNQSAVGLHDIIGIVALWGDPYPAASVQQTMYKTFDTLWHRRLMNELLILYDNGTNWHEGPGGYFVEGFTTVALGFAAISSALDRPYAAELPLFTGYGRFVHAVTRPNTLAKTCGSSGRDQCPPYYDRWGTISGGITGPSCGTMTLAAGMLRTQGQLEAAGLLKDAIDRYRGGCEGTGKSYGGTWANGWKSFLFGDKGITPTPPTSLPRTLKHGLGLYSMRSSYDASASQVMFFGQTFSTYGHGTPEYGTFTLHKYGNLILQASNKKSGEGAFVGVPSSAPSRGSLFQNVLTLHRGATHPGLGIQTLGDKEPRFAKLGIMSVVKTTATLTGEALNRPGFDYVGYDTSHLFLPTTATVSQREFVYLRGAENHEYLVVFDRFNALKPQDDEKIWRIWVPTQPEFVNGVVTQPRHGKWTSTTANTVSVTNVADAMSNSDFVGGSTHGRFFMKTLSPEKPVINFLGGDKAEFQSGDDDGSTPWGTPVMTRATREYVGWGRIEVRPPTARNYDSFLNVIQFGDASSLTAMAPVHKIAAGTVMSGAHVADPSNEWVTLFAEQAGTAFDIGTADYEFGAVSTSSNHLLLNMRRSTQYYVTSANTAGGVKVSVSTNPSPGAVTMTSDDSGVLHFTLSGLSVVAHETPSNPRNLRQVGQ